MTTIRRTTPATAAQLTEIFDGILKAPAGAPNTSAIEPTPRAATSSRTWLPCCQSAARQPRQPRLPWC